MKTFSDSNSTIEQERRKDAMLAMRVELLRQYDGLIVSRDSATQITVAGDATDLFALGDTLIIPLQSFPTNHILTAITYSAMDDETAIVCGASTFAASGLPGLQVAKRYIVSGGNTERMIEMSPVKFDLEGETLNSWLASDVDFRFDNGDGFFANSDGDGLFDGAEVIWVRVYFGWKRATDRVLYFGGVVELDAVKDDRYARTFTITVYGHLKELERYPAWLISDPNGDFLKLSGVEIISVTANDRTTEGIKKLEWKFSEGNLPGVEILSISKNAGNFGLVPLKFRFPNLFKYGWGAWTEVDENTASADLTGADGSTLTIKTTNYDVRDREVFLQVIADLNLKVNKAGAFELVYDNGPAARILSDFDTVIIDEGSTTYTDVSNDNDREGITYEALQASDAFIYLFSVEPFYGLEVFLQETDLLGTIELEYSNGLNSWQSLGGFTDGSNDFTQDGEITWTAEDVAGWRPVTFAPGGIDNVFQKFGMRISLTAYTSGSATVRNLRRYFKAFAADGTELAFKIDLHHLPIESVTEDLIIRQIADVWTPCTWYRNLTIQSLVEKIFTAASYGAGSYTLDDLKITSNAPVISIIGQAPAPFYQKRCKALLWDSGNEVLYLGVGNELWSVTETGDFIFIDELERINENADGYGLVELSIRSLALDGGDIHGMAWWDGYDDMIVHAGDHADASFYTWFFKSDGSAITEVLQASGGQQTSSPQYIDPCEQMMRQGRQYISGADFLDVIGQKGAPSNFEAGENLIIPFPQVIRNFYSDNSPNFTGQYLLDVEALLSNVVSSSDLFYFSELLSSADGKNGPFFRVLTNLFQMSDDALGANEGWINFKWQLGNSGLSKFYAGEGFIVLQMQRDNDAMTDTNHRIVKISTDQALTEIYDLSDSLLQPLCGVVLGDYLYFAYMLWDDLGTDLSTCVLARIDLVGGTLDALFNFSTDAAEASQSITGDEATQTVLELVYNSTEQVFYGCLLNRENFEYHIFVYDPFTDKMYSTQTGEDFTFDKHRQFKDFVYFDDKVYAVCVDKRYQTAGAFLVEMTFSSLTIHLSRIDTIDATDWDHLTMIATDDALFGVTGKGLLWKYSTTFYPRVGYADLGDKDLREVLNDAVQVLNRVITARPDRTLRIVERENYDGTKSLYDDKHIVSLQPLERWEHFYDRVEVSWKDPISGQSGIESTGTNGWQRRLLKLDNPFIQNRHLAAVIAPQYHTFFNQERKVVPAELTALLDLEEYDRVRFVLNTAQTDLARADYYLLTSLMFDMQTMILKIKGLN